MEVEVEEDVDVVASAAADPADPAAPAAAVVDDVPEAVLVSEA